MISRHPLGEYLPRLQKYPLIASTGLRYYAGQKVTMAGWLIMEHRIAVKTGHGIMKFITLEDTQGVFEAVLFPETYQTYGHLLTTHGPYLVTGEVQAENGAYTLLVDHLELMPGHQLSRTAPTLCL